MGKDSSSKARPSKSDRRSSKHSKSSSSRHATNGHSSSSDAPLSFLFVVNEVKVVRSDLDSWGLRRPPHDPSGYAPEVASVVMHYYDGMVVQLPSTSAYWGRNEENPHGGIFVNDDMQGLRQAETYSTATICSCHPLMPFAMVRTDATVEETVSADAGEDDLDATWQPLLVFHPSAADGISPGQSQVVFRSTVSASGSLLTYVAGQQASWMPYLVPKVYQNPSTNSPQSHGLGGDLTILLGLMSFTAKWVESGRPRAETVFGPEGRWRNRKWHHRHSPSGYNKSMAERAQALVITVALDPWNPIGSTWDSLENFEISEVAIRE